MKTNVNSRIVKVYNENIISDGEEFSSGNHYVIYPKLECGVNVLKIPPTMQQAIIDLINRSTANFFNLYIIPQNYEIGKEIIVTNDYIDWSKITNAAITATRIVIAYDNQVHNFGTGITKGFQVGGHTYCYNSLPTGSPLSTKYGVYFGVNVTTLS